VRSRGWLTGHDYDPVAFPGVVTSVNTFMAEHVSRFEPLEVRGTVWIARKR
jgi:hypothetical protein